MYSLLGLVHVRDAYDRICETDLLLVFSCGCSRYILHDGDLCCSCLSFQVQHKYTDEEGGDSEYTQQGELYKFIEEEERFVGQAGEQVGVVWSQAVRANRFCDIAVVTQVPG